MSVTVLLVEDDPLLRKLCESHSRSWEMDQRVRELAKSYEKTRFTLRKY